MAGPRDTRRELIEDRRLDEAGTLAVYDPSSEVEIGRLVETTTAELTSVVEQCAQAQIEWAGFTIEDRSSVMEGVADLLVAHAPELSLLESLDSGNPITSCARDVELCARYIRHWSALARGIVERKWPTGSSRLAFEDLQPFGVVASILAYNKPLLFAVKGTVPALLMGNAVIVKPAPQTSLVALAYEHLLHGVLPDGLAVVVLGGAELARHLAAHPRLRRLAFTGSAEAALALEAESTRGGIVKSLSFELGGVNPIMAFPDVPPATIADAVVRGMSLRSTAGQSCQATSRLLVHKASRDEVVEELAERLLSLRLGVAYDESTEIGPLVSGAHRARVLSWLDAAKAEGAVPVGVSERRPVPDEGYFMRPVAVTGLGAGSPLWSTEIFGPVVAVACFHDEEEAVQLANATPFGLTASVWSRDLGRGLNIARRIDAGYVWVNDVADHVVGMPFGGMKGSGVGREEALETLMSYAQSRSVVARLTTGEW